MSRHLKIKSTLSHHTPQIVCGYLCIKSKKNAALAYERRQLLVLKKAASVDIWQERQGRLSDK